MLLVKIFFLFFIVSVSFNMNTHHKTTHSFGLRKTFRLSPSSRIYVTISWIMWKCCSFVSHFYMHTLDTNKLLLFWIGLQIATASVQSPWNFSFLWDCSWSLASPSCMKTHIKNIFFLPLADCSVITRLSVNTIHISSVRLRQLKFPVSSSPFYEQSVSDHIIFPEPGCLPCRASLICYPLPLYSRNEARTLPHHLPFTRVSDSLAAGQHDLSVPVYTTDISLVAFCTAEKESLRYSNLKCLVASTVSLDKHW
jgi:hypothetical protein